MEHFRTEAYRSWLLGEFLLVCLLASATGLFAANESLQSAYTLPEARIAFDAAVAVIAGIVAVLAGVRFLVEGGLRDLLLAAGFSTIALGTAAFGLAPALAGGPLPVFAAWALLAARGLGTALIAAAPFMQARA
ncbi:MAG TPA: hypothetical protein VNJ46_08545, partial [Gaiellaceae bacterium]|nr:hypothetical protein [Gaiellaceae bacterium]